MVAIIVAFIYGWQMNSTAYDIQSSITDSYNVYNSAISDVTDIQNNLIKLRFRFFLFVFVVFVNFMFVGTYDCK